MKTNTQPILSLCLPTNGAVHWVIPTLDAIYAQGVDLSLFEVVITDNGENSQLGEALSKYNHPNLRYIPTNDSGFLNLITALKLGRGLYCKMLNHRSCLVPGALQMMIELVERYKETMPILYFSDGQLENDELIECSNLDKFVNAMHYWATWSGGVGVWQKDLHALDGLQLNELFPQSALMFDIRPESAYVICNRKFQDMQNEDGKGGYDLFYAFAVEFPNILKTLVAQGRMSDDTYKYVMQKLYVWLTDLYDKEVVHKSNHTFIIHNVRMSISYNYGFKGYINMALKTRYNLWKRRIIREIKKLL